MAKGMAKLTRFLIRKACDSAGNVVAGRDEAGIVQAQKFVLLTPKGIGARHCGVSEVEIQVVGCLDGPLPFSHERRMSIVVHRVDRGKVCCTL